MAERDVYSTNGEWALHIGKVDFPDGTRIGIHISSMGYGMSYKLKETEFEHMMGKLGYVKRPERTQPPFHLFKNPICKGSYALGTACGTCEKCKWEQDQSFPFGRRLEEQEQLLDQLLVRSEPWET